MDFKKVLSTLDYKLIWDYLNEMDFESQKLTFYYYKLSTVIFAIIFFFIGLFFESYQITIIGNLIVLAINIIIFVPGWPIWKRNARKFLVDDKKTK